MSVDRHLGRARLREFFALDSDWARVRPDVGRHDVLFALMMMGLGLVTLELLRSVGVLDEVEAPAWAQVAATLSAPVLLIWRRNRPLTVWSLAALHIFVVGLTMPILMGQLTMQLVYFSALYSAVAWSLDRRQMAIVVGLSMAALFVWIAWDIAVGSGIDTLIGAQADAPERTGLIPPFAAGATLILLINILLFGGTILGGQLAWQGARQRAELAQSALTIAAQSHELQRRAVVDERLRIARELHDVVGHHVAAIGVQAAAARRMLTHDGVAAASALTSVEQSSRDAVTQMRGLLGTLRDLEGGRAAESSGGGHHRDPGIAEIPALAAQWAHRGLTVGVDWVGPEAAFASVPGPASLTAYRVVQESLANVARHSTASTASVAVRAEGVPVRALEVEVIDAGRPRHDSGGSGLGHLGIRERAAAHRGSVEIGPRMSGGYRVRVRLPVGGEDG